MAPNLAGQGHQVPSGNMKRRQQSRPESCQDDPTSTSPVPTSRKSQPKGANDMRDHLAQNEQPDMSRKHSHDKEPRAENSNKRLKRSDDSTATYGTSGKDSQGEGSTANQMYPQSTQAQDGQGALFALSAEQEVIGAQAGELEACRFEGDILKHSQNSSPGMQSATYTDLCSPQNSSTSPDMKLEAAKQPTRSDSNELETLQKKFEALQKEHQALLVSHEARIEVSNEDSHRFVKMDKAKEAAKKAAKKKLEEAQKAHDEEKVQLARQIEKAKFKISHLKAEHGTEASLWNDQKNELLQQLRESQGLNQRYNFSISDAEITATWRTLKHKIGQFVNIHTRPISDSSRQVGLEWLDKLSPDIYQLLEDPVTCPRAFEALMWEQLRLLIFNDESTAWAGSLGPPFALLSSKVENGLRRPHDELTDDYHSWRATSSNILSRFSDRNWSHESYRANVETWAASLEQLLGPEFDTNSALNDISEIVSDARAFEITRRKLKAYVVMIYEGKDTFGHSARYDMPVDGVLMHTCSGALIDTTAHRGAEVQLVVSPAIMRWGNSLGTNYDQRKCIVKMDVLTSPVSEDASMHSAPIPGDVQQRGEGASTPQEALANMVKNEPGAKAAPSGESDVREYVQLEHGVKNDAIGVNSTPKKTKLVPRVQGPRLDDHHSSTNSLAVAEQSAPAVDSSTTRTRPPRAADVEARKTRSKAQQESNEQDSEPRQGAKFK